MEFIIIIIVTIILSVLLGYVFSFNKKKILDLAKNEKLDEMAKKYPSNIEICKKYLKKLNNKDVTIEENKEAEASLYIAITNKIVIANINDTFTRIQTIAHECLHSIQDRKILIFNFAFSNIYLLYYVVICVLELFNLLPFKMMFLTIFLIASLINYVVRMYLENDAMIKARFLAKEYLEEENTSTKEEINEMVKGFDNLNNLGMKYIHYQFFLDCMLKVLIFSIICIF